MDVSFFWMNKNIGFLPYINKERRYIDGVNWNSVVSDNYF